MRLPLPLTVLALFCSAVFPLAAAGDAPVKADDLFPAADTLQRDAEPNADAAECLTGLRWEPGKFTVSATPSTTDADWLLRFPSPLPGGIKANDSVGMEWYLQRDAAGAPVKAPALVVIHESGREMVAGRMFARGMRLAGCHTFLLHLPGYGSRKSAITGDLKKVFHGLRQASADARRARDAVAALPFVDTTRIGLCGISLGGFVTATTVGLDHGYARAFILLAGGNLADVVFQGARDAATLRRQLREAGVTDDEVRAAIRTIEPMRLARRVDREHVWLFSAQKDEVVPPACSVAFAQAARLPAGHHVEYPGGHYSVAIVMPVIMRRISEIMLDLPPLPGAESSTKQ